MEASIEFAYSLKHIVSVLLSVFPRALLLATLCHCNLSVSKATASVIVNVIVVTRIIVLFATSQYSNLLCCDVG